MIVSGWLALNAPFDELAERWTAEVGGIDVLAQITISALSLGGHERSYAEGSITGYSQGQGFVNLGRDARRNAYTIDHCESVQFDLWGLRSRSVVHAAAFPVSSPAHLEPLARQHQRYAITVQGRIVAHHRISVLRHGSRLDVSQALQDGMAPWIAARGRQASDCAFQRVDEHAAPPVPNFTTP